MSAIQHSCFLPWNKMVESDHQAGFVDFDELILFGNTDNLTHSAPRKLTTEYPEAMDIHLKNLSECFKKRNIFYTLERFAHQAKIDWWYKPLTKKINKLDKEVKIIIRGAENICIPTTNHTSEYSTTLERATRAIRYWNMQISQYKKQKENQDILNKEKAAGNNADTSNTMGEAQQLRSESWAHLITILKYNTDALLRDLQRKVQECLTTGETEKSQAYDRLIEKEKVKTIVSL